MRIIARRALMEAAAKHGDCVELALTWYRVASTANWASLAEVRITYPHADKVGDKTVFNLKGNRYRLIVHINYESQIVYFKDLLTHAVYDKQGWK